MTFVKTLIILVILKYNYCLCMLALHQEKMPPPLDAHGIWLHNVNDMDLQ
jgi:hypothetical protein